MSRNRPTKKQFKEYPLLVLKNTVVFPHERVTIMVDGKESVETIRAAEYQDEELVVVAEKEDGRSRIGVVARILQSSSINPTVLGAVIEGRERVEIVGVKGQQPPNQTARVIPVGSHAKTNQRIEALSRRVLSQLKELADAEETSLPLILNQLQREHLSPEETSDLAAASLRLDFADKVRLLETADVAWRLNFLNQKLARELAVVEVEKKIRQEVHKKVTEEQRHFYLREHLKAIEKELGVGGAEEEFAELKRRIEEAQLPPDVERRAYQELQRLRAMPPASAEAPYIRTYLGWLLDVPWGKRKRGKVNLTRSRKVLDAEHYALEKTKNRILEYLAVEKLTKGKHRGSIMCFVGPPGTGKTSVGKSIAQALDRDFVRVSLGGLRDEAEIRGHRRTYVGAMPGRIIQGIREAGSNNPVFMLDEIDKIGADFRGDPAAALLEVLDPQQNEHFSDHYLEVPFDLSNVIFIATANVLDPIPAALRDRMEVIEFSGYTEEEKFHIAKTFLLPRVLTAHGLTADRLRIRDAALRTVIAHYTREAGVRHLERRLAEVARKVARAIAEGRQQAAVTIAPKNLGTYLGIKEYESPLRESADEVGVSTGLAWMPSGGEIIFIETRLMPGSGKLTLTGQLGKIMQESAKAALSYVRSRSEQLGFDSDFYDHTDIHVHVPSGAIAKDGPSAGAAIATALASSLAGRKIKSDTAITGEISLTGKLLPVGGIKEKILAAHRAGITSVVLPRKNEKHLSDVPQSVRQDIRIVFADHMDDVLPITLAGSRVATQTASAVSASQIAQRTASWLLVP